MIISHRHRFIFIKTNKTAGTSVEIALSQYCGPEDVITPISPEDEAKRQALGYPGAQNHKVPFLQCLAHYLRHRKWPRLYNHMSAEEVIRIVGREVWETYFTFCFERNPWERALSLYHWRGEKTGGMSFSEFLRSPQLDRLKTKGADLYLSGDQLLVDHVGQYENLEVELAEIGTRVGLPGPLELHRTKNRTRPARAEVELTADDVALISERFSREIERFGYVYER